MIAERRCHCGDIFFDDEVSGNVLERPGLTALMREAEADKTVSHIFIPKRERLARPDHPIEGMALEMGLRQAGITLVFSDRIVEPINRGRREDIGESLTTLIDYHVSGKFRDDHAEKMIAAKLALAVCGHSTGGRAPYGFRRNLVNGAGQAVRELVEGERVRLAGHHVAWLPGPKAELDVIFRIVAMLETMPALQVAKTLTDEKIPSPDADRFRTDNGIKHRVRGAWYQTTIVSLARNPLLRAMVAFGRRSMGERRRTTLGGPREVVDEDFRSDGKPKVRQVDKKDQIIVQASFAPLLSPERASNLDAILDKRAGTQRGKPRSHDPARNPLGCRIFDMACSWPMYRAAAGGEDYFYRCGLYQQSDGEQCKHNRISGPAASRFGLEIIRQQFHNHELRRRLREKLEARMQQVCTHDPRSQEAETLRVDLAEAKARLDKVGRNMAFADTPEQREAMKKVFDGVSREVRMLEERLTTITTTTTETSSPDVKIEKAFELLDRLPELVDRASDMGTLARLFQIPI